MKIIVRKIEIPIQEPRYHEGLLPSDISASFSEEPFSKLEKNATKRKGPRQHPTKI